MQYEEMQKKIKKYKYNNRRKKCKRLVKGTVDFYFQFSSLGLSPFIGTIVQSAYCITATVKKITYTLLYFSPCALVTPDIP